ncbi:MULTISPECIES: hypothetical protein [unclassified Streptomyces]|uniref:hypothetical protein n=1 Tax=unclassified Streptomyces TaxID=2593676 RepID=UPI00081B4C07|nr:MULTISPECIES: hypothetical protein [unclassified Streptomyces]SCD76548.1 hypothetical protein GA0115239_107720 [Streptomyces sp. BpilaLS-43]
MAREAERHPRVQNLTSAGTALAVTLLPLAVGVLLARAVPVDPMASVNALVTGGGQRARIAPSRLVLRARTRALLARGGTAGGPEGRGPVRTAGPCGPAGGEQRRRGRHLRAPARGGGAPRQRGGEPRRAGSVHGEAAGDVRMDP